MIRLELNGATVLYTGREGGVSEGPYAELNLGLRTDDDPEAVSANYDLLAVQTGISRRNFALGHQVHGIEVRAHREPPSDADRAREADGQATRLEGVTEGRYELAALPLKLVGADGAPLRAVLIA